MSSLISLAWQDVFVLIDEGQASVVEYRRVTRTLQERAREYPSGIGCLTVIPGHASPPPEPARAAIASALGSIEGSIRCLCWLVEADGFKGAMVQGILTGLRMLQKRSYPTHVSSSLQQSLAWILPHLKGGTARLADVVHAVRAIDDERARLERGPKA